MVKLAVIIGSTRPGRNGEAVGRWVHDIAAKRGDAEVGLVDLKDYNLPHLDEPMPAQMQQYVNPHTKAWSQAVASYDAFVFVTPEYNRSTSGALKNAIDFLYAEWANKSAGFVGYGVAGGARAVEHLRGVMSGIQIADVTAQVLLSMYTDFENFSVFKPAAQQEEAVSMMLDQVISWGGALRAVRA
ncbi:NAD(P)H-dependent oxidoreductase [Actinoplanes sp. NPDC048967]|uniref:NADPH-dependent FMN reductase n=1 Tax=Actinoplanes sp. NPDC048967 TaxID=3155269 RepID=UPI0033E5CDAE